MKLLCVFVAVFLGSALASRFVRAHAALVYGAAVAVSALYWLSGWVPLPRAVSDALFFLVQQCTLATALFAAVMLAGIFSQSSYFGSRLRPIRAELSVAASILCVGHIVFYATQFLSRITAPNAVRTQVIAAIAIAMVLLVLLIPLFMTSIDSFKRMIDAGQWKKIQKMAYPFFVLIFFHLGFMLVPSAWAGSSDAQLRLVVYGFVLVVYLAGKAIYIKRNNAAAALKKELAQGSAVLNGADDWSCESLVRS